MREINFRGISDYKEEWVYGFGLSRDKHTKDLFIQTEIDDYVFIVEGSEGQYTGLKDKNGVEIYEGDIIDCDYGFGKVVFLEFCWCIEYNEGNIQPFINHLSYNFNGELESIYDKFIVVGNIYEDENIIREVF